MSDVKPETKNDSTPKFKPKLPKGWEQLELPMDMGHTKIITRKTQP